MTLKTKSDVFQAMGFRPFKTQQEVADAPHLIRVMRWGRRSGAATLAAAELATALILKPNANCLTISPTKRMAVRYTECLRVFLQNLENSGHIRIVQADYDSESTHILLSNGSRYRVESAEQPDDIADPLINFLVLTDYFQIEPWVLLQQLFPPVVFANGQCLMTGTPMPYGDWGEREAKAQPSLWFFHTAPSYANPVEFPDGEQDTELVKLKTLMSDEDYRRVILAEVPTVVPRKMSPLKLRHEDRQLFVKAVEDWLDETFGDES